MVFEVFRKRQKTALAILAILAMFAFIGTSFFTASSTGDPIFAVRDASGKEVAVEIDGEPVTHSRIERVQSLRGKLNSFLNAVAQASSTEPQRFPSPFEQIAMRQFGYPEGLVSLALEKKAEQLGIVVSEEEAWDWLKEVSGGKLKASDFEDILAGRSKAARQGGGTNTKISLTMDEMMKGLRRELAARQVIVYSLPSGPLDTPIDLWQMQGATDVKVSLEFVEIPIEKYLANTKAPSDEEIQRIYEERKSKESNPETGFVGFLQPRRVELQYAEAKIEDFLGDVEVTDEEIAKYYEEHKADFEDKPPPSTDVPIPDVPAPPADLPPAPEGAAPAPSEPSPPNPDSPPAPQAPADPAPQPMPQPEPVPQPPTEPQSPPPAPTPAEPPKQAEGSARATSLRPALIGAAFGSLTAFQSAEPAPSEPSPAEPAPVPTPPPAEPAPSPSAPSPTEPATTDPATVAPAPKEPTAPPSDPVTPDAAPEEPPVAPPPPPEPKYKPLEQVKEEIRKTLAKEKMRPILEKKMHAMSETLKKEYRQARVEWRNAPKNKEGELPQFVPPDMAKLAAENKFQFKTIGPLTKTQLKTEAGIGQAVPLAKSKGEAPTDVMPGLAFSGDPGEGMYSPGVLYNEKTGAYYLYWKTKDEAAMELPLDQVREQVIEVARKNEALAEAAKAAKDLIDKAKEQEKTLADVLDPAAGLQAKTSSEFARQAPQFPVGDDPASRGQAEIRIPEIEGADASFVASVFEKGEGELLTLADAKNENYYALRVAGKTKFDPNKFREQYPMVRLQYTYGSGIPQQQVLYEISQVISDLDISPEEFLRGQ